jgi:tRNA(Ile)-lysidine synthase
VPSTLHDRLRHHLQRLKLLRAGEGVGIAVSGGADSVALLCLLLDLRKELGLVLSVVHFNHRIRGPEALADERFVQALAERFELPFHSASADVPAYARKARLSLEAAARTLRYQYFHQLLTGGSVARIATAHTLDDQAETVLLRLIRGAGTRGLAGIYPEIKVERAGGGAPPQQSKSGLAGDPGAAIVRPLLEFRRPELVQYLRSAGQEWREDASNLDPKHTRNRIRQVLLPLLESEFNPSIREVLADTAAMARAEEDYWQRQIEENPLAETDREAHTAHFPVRRLERLPLALRRRMLRAVAERIGLRLDFRQVERILQMCAGQPENQLELPRGWRVESKRGAIGVADRVLTLCQTRFHTQGGPKYEYAFHVPGEVAIPEIGAFLRTSLVCLASTPAPEFPSRDLLDAELVMPATEGGGSGLRVRNWRPGDRFWPPHAKASKKVKEVLQAGHLYGRVRTAWPVIVTAQEEVVWLRNFGVCYNFAPRQQAREAVWIECRPLGT